MKLAIHHRKGSFSDRWIAICEEKKIPYKIVDCYSNNIIDQLKDCDGVMWHHHHEKMADVLFAKSLLFSLESAGKKVFPDFNTGWHFDDKVAQKYLLEAVGAPLIPTYVFYSSEQALKWCELTSFPKVFKLRGGAGSSNVKLIKTRKAARKIIQKAFSSGFKQFDPWHHLRDRIQKKKQGKESWYGVAKAIGRLFIPTHFSQTKGKERGYVYFQDFIPANNFDIRVVLVGQRAFAIKRLVRENDFRASGSGKLLYRKDEFDEACIRVAFETNQKIKSQCIAFDFVYDETGKPLIVEISFGFSYAAYDKCEGYWDKDLRWYEGAFNPQEWMLEDFLNTVK